MDTRDEQIVSLFQTGHSQRAIARLTGLSQPGVRKRLFRLGLLPAVPLASREAGRRPAGVQAVGNLPTRLD